MSSNPRNNDDELGLKPVAANDDPTREMARAYGQALDGLPKSLRQPIADYVKRHVELELAPAPVTKATYLAHLVLCAVNFLIMLAVFEIERHATVNANDFLDSLASAGKRSLAIWGASVLLALIMRIQTRSFRLSQVFLACTFGYLGFVAADLFEPVALFFITPRWLATALLQILYFSVFIFWLHWFLESALPTTRVIWVRVVSASICTAVCFGIFAVSYNHIFDEDEVPETKILPFAGSIGGTADISALLDRNLASAVANAPDLADAQQNRGRSFLEVKKYDLALASFNKAIEVNPKDWSGFYGRSEAWLEMGEFDRALQDIDEAQKLRKDKKFPNFRRVAIYFNKDQYDLALKTIDSNLEEYPSDSNSFHARGVVNFFAGNFEEASKAFGQAYKLAPKDLRYAVWQEISNRKLGKASQLNAQIERTKQKSWSRGIASMYLGRSSLDQVFSALKEESAKDYGCPTCRKCETDFFGGEWELLNGRNGAARKLFNDAISTCGKGELMGHAAEIELKRMK